MNHLRVSPTTHFVQPLVKDDTCDGTMAVKKNTSETKTRPGAIVFKTGDFICEYPAVLVNLMKLPVKGRQNFEELFWMYMIAAGSFVRNTDKTLESRLVFLSVFIENSHAQIVGSSCEDCRNVEFFVDEKEQICMKAVRNLRGGDKLWVSYGKEFWCKKTDVYEPICPVCELGLREH